MRQRSEQYFTSSQTFSHFLRHVKGRWQWMQTLLGRLAFLIIFIKGAILEIQGDLKTGWRGLFAFCCTLFFSAGV